MSFTSIGAAYQNRTGDFSEEKTAARNKEAARIRKARQDKIDSDLALAKQNRLDEIAANNAFLDSGGADIPSDYWGDTEASLNWVNQYYDANDPRVTNPDEYTRWDTTAVGSGIRASGNGLATDFDRTFRSQWLLELDSNLTDVQEHLYSGGAGSFTPPAYAKGNLDSRQQAILDNNKLLTHYQTQLRGWKNDKDYQEAFRLAGIDINSINTEEDLAAISADRKASIYDYYQRIKQEGNQMDKPFGFGDFLGKALTVASILVPNPYVAGAFAASGSAAGGGDLSDIALSGAGAYFGKGGTFGQNSFEWAGPALTAAGKSESGESSGSRLTSYDTRDPATYPDDTVVDTTPGGRPAPSLSAPLTSGGLAGSARASGGRSTTSSGSGSSLGRTPNTKFDPEGSGYDYATAKAHGLAPDETGHWPSRSPKTGQLLKGRTHSTYPKTVAGEEKAGYTIRQGEDGRYYSRRAGETLGRMPKKSGTGSGSGTGGESTSDSPPPESGADRWSRYLFGGLASGESISDAPTEEPPAEESSTINIPPVLTIPGDGTVRDDREKEETEDPLTINIPPILTIPGGGIVRNDPQDEPEQDTTLPLLLSGLFSGSQSTQDSQQFVPQTGSQAAPSRTSRVGITPIPMLGRGYVDNKRGQRLASSRAGFSDSGDDAIRRLSTQYPSLIRAFNL